MKSTSPAVQEIWSLIKETQKNIKDLSASHKEEMKELRAGQKELQTSQKETDRQLKETDRQLKETDRQLKKTDNRFNSQWGKLVESLVEGKLVELLKGRGIEVHQTSQRHEVSYNTKDGQVQKREFDILVINNSEVVAVEVKTTLTPDKVNYFLSTMKNFKKYFSQYKSYTVYGAVAYLKSDAKASLFADRKGLFVIKATGDSASIVNKADFKPKVFS